MTSTEGAIGHPLIKLSLFREDDEATLAKRARLPLRDFLPIALSLIAVTAAITLFHIEEGLDLPKLMWITAGGFLVYAYLPVRYRLPFFLILNIAALMSLFGAALGLTAFGLGSLLIFCASLNIRHHYRVAFVLLLSGGLIFLKSGAVGGADKYQLATILGGLFMFRLILYLYEIRHEKKPVTVWKRVSYFFLLPNLVFLIFPIVDYKTFVRGFYARPAAETYRKGVHWIFIGFVHLLVYRAIYSYAIPVPDDVEGLFSLVQYLIFSYALIIRLSGIFHLSMGIICLFGFDLPRTFNNYFLSSSFSDLWNRINIYWRGFVMKVFYFPIFMRFKNRGGRAVFITVILVFTVNFFLHAYQWFWIRGTFLVSETDMVFWGILGLMLAVNSVFAVRRKRSEIVAGFSWSRAAVLSLKILGMFTFMCVMWSIWTSNSLDIWWRFMQRGAGSGFQDYAIAISVCFVLLALGIVIQYLRALPKSREWMDVASAPLPLSFITCISAALCTVTSPQVIKGVETRWSLDMTPILSEQLNEHDVNLLRKGYYEELIVGNTITSRVWELREYEKTAQPEQLESDFPEDVGRGKNDIARKVRTVDKKTRMEERRLIRKRERALERSRERGELGGPVKLKRLREPTNDLRMKRLKPDNERLFLGAVFRTNGHGMRDRDYSLEKLSSTFRIALLGGSPQMGTGVEDSETAENVAENQLNSEGGFGPYDKLEILNFSMSDFGLINQIGLAEAVLGDFSPDMILLHLHSINEQKRNRPKFAEAMVKNLVSPYPFLERLRRELDIVPDTTIEDASERLKPYESELFNWALDWLNQYCKDRDMSLVVVIQDGLGISKRESMKYATRHAALLSDKSILQIDIGMLREGYTRDELIILPWDNHPNAKAHKLIAGKLIEGLRQHQAALIGD